MFLFYSSSFLVTSFIPILYRHHHHYHYHHHFFVISNMRLKTGNQNANHHLLSLIYGQRDCTNVPSKKDKQFWMLKNIFTHVRLFTHQAKQYLLYLSCFLLQAVSFVVHWPCDDDFYGKTIRILFVALIKKQQSCCDVKCNMMWWWLLYHLVDWLFEFLMESWFLQLRNIEMLLIYILIFKKVNLCLLVTFFMEDFAVSFLKR